MEVGHLLTDLVCSGLGAMTGGGSASSSSSSSDTVAMAGVSDTALELCVKADGERGRDFSGKAPSSLPTVTFSAAASARHEDFLPSSSLLVSAFSLQSVHPSSLWMSMSSDHPLHPSLSLNYRSNSS